MSTVLAVDPGKTTGYALWTDGERVEGELYAEAFLDYAESVLKTGTVDTVVCERFIITTRTGKLSHAPWSLEQIGALRHLCHVHRVNFVLQNVSDAKKFGTDQRLNLLGWKRPQGAGHARDAQRHLLVHLVRTKELSASELLEAAQD